jgi:hypothetical protein
MATWTEFCGLARGFGGDQLGEDVWRFDVQGRGETRTQKVMVIHEVMPPMLEFIEVQAGFAMIDAVDCEDVLKRYGALHVGAIAYTPRYAADGAATNGFLSVKTSIPLGALDLSDPTTFFLYLNVLGQAADQLEQEFGTPGSSDLF